MHRWIPVVCLRFFTPLVLLTCCLARPSVMSLLYGLLLLAWPFVPSVGAFGTTASTKKYLIIFAVVSCVNICAQLIFHVIFYVLSAGFSECDKYEIFLRTVGLQRLDVPNIPQVARVICPEIGATICSVITAIVSFLYQSSMQPLDEAEVTVTSNGVGTSVAVKQKRKMSKTKTHFQLTLHRISELLPILLLALIGVVSPSVLSSLYFMTFLVIATWWSVYLPLKRRRFNLFKLALLIYSALHLILLYAFQLQPFQMKLPPNSLIAKLFGLTAFVEMSCDNVRTLTLVNSHAWSVYANPALLFLFYMYLSIQYSIFSQDSVSQDDGQFRNGALRKRSYYMACSPEIEQQDNHGDEYENEEDPFLNVSSAEENGTNKRLSLTARELSRLFSFEQLSTENVEFGVFGVVLSFVIKHSYVLSLVMMMAWAISYHCWLSFVWLVLACLIWLLKDSRKACLTLSPLIVVYAEALLCLEFIYGIRSNIVVYVQDIWPEDLPNIPLQQIGLITPDGPPCIPLLLKIFFSLPFWVTLRLHLREKYHRPTEDHSKARAYGTFEPYNKQIGGVSSGNSFFGDLLVKYWIYVVGLVLLIVSIRQSVVAYSVCYMIFFVVLITVLQISFRAWRIMLFSFWLFLIIFSICTFLFVYTYQFHEIPSVWKNWTGWATSENQTIDVFGDLGLVDYETGSLFLHLLTPISFLIVVILQLKFFHTEFMHITEFGTSSRSNLSQTTQNSTRPSCAELITTWYETASEFGWRFLELHIGKLVAFSLIMLAVYEVCVVNFVLVFFVSIMLPFRSLHTTTSILSCCWLSAVVVAKMLYQMSFVRNTSIEVNVYENCSIFANSVDPAKWAGFEKVTSVAWYLKTHVLIFILLTLQAIVKLRQRHYRLMSTCGELSSSKNVLFPNITRTDADETIVKCLKFFVNHWFYKMGVETCFIVMVIDIGIRMDAVALLYSIWLLILLALPRHTLARIWWCFVLFVAILLPIQYALSIGLPPSPCMNYPWLSTTNGSSDEGSSTTKDNLFVWLYLPNFNRQKSPSSLFLIGDFFVFLCSCCQLYVFKIEYGSRGEEFDGGDNESIEYRRRRKSTVVEAQFCNPVPNFITYTKSYLDMAKIIVFSYFHWVTLVIIFVAGFGRISAFAFGYLVAAFCLLWKGNDLYLESFRYVRIRWYALVVYNVSAIFLKVVLQVIGCVYMKTLCNENPLIIRMFSITCLRTTRPAEYPPGSECYVSAEEAEIFYDGLCFAVLMLQMRIFHSWYFKHTIAEFRAERILSARGAILISQLIKKEMKEQQENEKMVLAKLVNKTTKIRDTYLKKFRGKKPSECETYGEGKRCGDYYMFDYESDSESEENTSELEQIEEIKKLDPTVNDKDKITIGPLQLAHMVLAKDFNLEQTVEHCKVKLRQLGSVDFGPSLILREALMNQAGSNEDEEPIKKKTTLKRRWKKLFAALNLIEMFLSSILDRCTVFFNKWSRDCRYVNYVLKNEKRLLMDTLTKELEGETSLKAVQEKISTKEIGKKIRKIPTDKDIESVEKKVQQFIMQHNVVVRFFIALYYLIFSRTELLCYMMMILDHMTNASILSLPLPLLALFWGTLCSPRPPKFFWITVITYTEAMIVIKFIFQFGFFPTKSALSEPFHPNNIIGLDKTHYYVVWDVALLMLLFFHRYILKVLGLWKDFDHEENLVDETVDEDSQKPESENNSESAAVTKPDDNKSRNLSAIEEETVASPTRLLAEMESENKENTISSQTVNICETDKRCTYCSCFVSFYRRLLYPTYKYITDMYSLMFLCDLICFLILAFGYSSFGVAAEQGDVVSDIKSNKVPLPFVSMLISLMILIIIDRGLYLRKSVVGKLLFQYLLIIVVHAWIFFALPFVTGRSIVENTSAQLWYFVKCIYFLLSAWQIKNGYRSRRMGNLLTKRYNLLNYCFFTGFMAAPFLFELRTLIDWIWTETSMPLFDYFSMENIYAAVYRLKCMRKMEKDYPITRGMPQGSAIKYGIGIPILIFIVVLLWLPLLLFALLKAIGVGLLPIEAKFSIAIKGYPPLYEMEAHDSFLRTLSEYEYNHMMDSFPEIQALMFLRDYNPGVTQKATFQRDSNLQWDVSLSTRQKLYFELNNSSRDVSLLFRWEFTRPRESSEKEPVIHTSQHTVILTQIDEARHKLAKLIKNGGSSDEVISIDYAFPMYVEVPSFGEVSPVRPLLSTMINSSDPLQQSYASVQLTKIKETWSNGDVSTVSEFWRVQMIERTKSGLGNKMENIEMTVFVGKVFPSALDAFTSKGIIGVYVVVVLAAGRFMRTFVVTSPLEVIITEMPYVDKLLQLCLDIFLVREAGDFFLELDLFAKLIFLIRSPETLIKWTRPKRH